MVGRRSSVAGRRDFAIGIGGWFLNPVDHRTAVWFVAEAAAW